MATYAEKLKDPRWQKKRLEVLSKNDFSCEVCGDAKSTLHVHHKEYFKNREPWEYEVDQLACICKECHQNEHDYIDPLKMVSSYLDMDGPCGRGDFASLIVGYAAGYIDFPVIINTDQQLVSSPYSCAIGAIAAAFRNEFRSSDIYAISQNIHADPATFAKVMQQFITPRKVDDV